jgi:valyl-tRNA synthetase
MSISKVYSPKEVENKWYTEWQKQGFFKAIAHKSSKGAYTIVIPPPNVTGVLHMGHMLNNTIQDILVRRKRMQGFDACWVPGTDHASIATEAKVVAMLKEKGINKKDLSREDFLKYAWEWKEKYGGIILEQLKKLGASCDWDRTRFTMEEPLSEAVIEVFIKLYEKGLIYRGARMVNWDPQGLTAVSDEEVIYKEVQSKLHFIKYYAQESQEDFFTIATTRPETIMGDVAICVHPEDERYKHLIGKIFLVPLINRPIPVIADEAVDMGFGTGSLKITPAHDLVDYKIGQKHHLPFIDVLNPDGTISEVAQIYVGEDRFVARKKIVKELAEKGFLVESKDITNNIGTSERTGAVIEPRISTQWFCNMKELAKPALENVLNGNIKLHPNKFINTYKHWMENVQDWCISRQLWWGQRIPAWYDENSNYVIAATKNEALEKYKNKFNATPSDLKQDEDVLDTWFSSWLWPISVFDGFKDPQNKDFNYFYPTNDLVTAPEILFFWVARMIMAGYEFTGKLPFSNVYLTGIVRDKQGRKMSKSLGNSPDPIDLIEKYSADGVRVGMLYSSPAGNDLLFDEKYCEQGRNFANKVWNAFRLLKSWEIDATLAQPEVNKIAIVHFETKFNFYLAELEQHFENYRISDALMTVYKLVWDDFCAWYLESIKPNFEQPIDKATFDTTIAIFESLLKIMHPFMPFITEEIWHEIAERSESDCLIVASYPVVGLPLPRGEGLGLGSVRIIEDIISQIRNFRSSKGISPKESLTIEVNAIDKDKLAESKAFLKENMPLVVKLANIIESNLSADASKNTSSFLVNKYQISVLTEGLVDEAKEKEELEKERLYLEGFLKSVDAKLSNEKFVANAKPEAVANERKKKADAEAKLEAILKSLGL